LAAGGGVTVGGQGLPRLQELAYLETIAKAVASGLPFEQIRLALIDHIWGVRQSTPGDPPDPSDYRAWRSDEKKFVRNVTDAVKELMRLGFVENATLPSSGKSAYAHKEATYHTTAAGRDWVELLETDRRAAYDDLIPRLLLNHPGFRCFLSAVGTIGDHRSSFVVPLLRWGELPSHQRTQQVYRTAIGDYVAGALSSSDLGWLAGAAEIDASVNGYLDRILARAQARERDPFPTVRTFTQTCEEALVRLAFSKVGCNIDYVSMEIARRWSRWLGLASFTYHAPGHNALRFWSTAHVDLVNGRMSVQRRAGGEWRDQALNALYEYCQQARNSGTTYLAVWEVRAAVCWKLRIVDDEFDRAVTDMIAGRRGDQLAWRIHLDQVSLGSIPSSAAPFVLTTSGAGTRAYNVMTVVPKPTK
jgi:hypothetical protein